MQIEVRPILKGATDKVEAMIARMADLSVPLAVEAVTLDALIQRGFAQSRSPWGEKWAPVLERDRGIAGHTSIRTSRGVFRSVAKGARPLVDTGLLRGSIVVRAAKDAVVVGVSGAAATYATVHQFGFSPRNITARPFLPVDKTGTPDLSRGPAKKWAEQVRKRIESYIVKGK